ncbi:LysM domain-containing protein [Prosthecobacter fusiformis]|uniref:LysM domain-containing protein n=1 Tax=Prosthecobacter fusiformis TaxID=48464 RepID=A0A4R7SRR1_9BACT|nr:LysM peptidoglycan-binding domain-containing protein [Prosthecobacter fusiformis]TDU81319.1 LysM domain-containing protein [Prosthecobacter fusiformis]
MISAARLLLTALTCTLLASCENGQNPFGQTGGSDPYVSNYGNDGGYNPYPGQTGYAQGGSSSYSSAPTYTPPPAPVEADPYAFNAPSSTPKTSSSSYSAPKKTVSSSKPKTSSKSTAKKSGGSYKVVKGDTLYGIARKRSTTVAKIKSANGLSTDIIRPGQTLRIP